MGPTTAAAASAASTALLPSLFAVVAAARSAHGWIRRRAGQIRRVAPGQRAGP